jgi:type IV pilus assembly protein PilW
MKTRFVANPSGPKGFSLIELMVALTISLLVSIGIVEIFGGSRATFQTQQGLSAVQESGRFSIQYLQHQLRMAGYMGCGGDTERQTQESFVNHMANYSATVPGGDAVADPKFRFQRPIEAFASADLPSDLSTLAPVNGTDVLVLRTASEESVPVVSIARTPDNFGLNIAVAPGATDVFGSQVDGQPIVYALQNCRSADVFMGTLAGASSTVSVAGNTSPNRYLDPTVTDCNPAGNCPWDFRVSNVFLNASHGGPAPTAPQLNAELHRGEYMVFYVHLNADPVNNPNNVPSLYVRRWKRDGSGIEDVELAQGIENLQVLFGVDGDGDGQVETYEKAVDVADGATGAVLDAKWRQVMSVRVGMIVRSPEVAGVSSIRSDGNPRTLTVLGTVVTPPDDHALRQVYETTVSVRNRIFNS